jgi:hypothetical protein
MFTIGFDLYMEISAASRLAVMKALKRDEKQWRLKNTCPCCSYKLKGEKKLDFEMLITMDGNNSLKRIRKNGTSTQELLDPRQSLGDYYIGRDEVEKWARGAAAQEDLIDGTTVRKRFLLMSHCTNLVHRKKQQLILAPLAGVI